MRPRDADCHPRALELSLVALADRQWGVASREQLHALGLSRTQIRTRIAQGQFEPIHHNVYAVARRRLDPRARLVAALLSVGPEAFLSHRTAAAVWGLRAIDVRNIELTLPGCGGRRHPGLGVHRSRSEPHPEEVRLRDGLRVSSVPRLLVELAARERPAELERLVTMAVQRRLLRPDARDGVAALEASLARHSGRAGMRTLKVVLAAYRRVTSAKSGLERAFDRLLAHHPDIPDPECNMHLDVWELDRCWPQHRLAVELDGRPYHIAVADMERDRIKDAALLRLGWTPLRFTDLRLELDPAGILADLRHFLGLRE